MTVISAPLPPLDSHILDLAYDGIFLITLDGTIVFWNRGAEEMYGWKRQEALGRIVHELLQTRFPEPLDRIVQKLRSDGHWDGELVHTTRDGRERIVSSRWALERDAEGQPAWFLEIVRDITERKHFENEIRSLNESLEQRVIERTRELAEANRELESFSYSVSHDLRAPLRSIDGFSRLVLEECSALLDEKAKDRLERIHAAAARMGQLIDALLDLSRLTRIEIRSERVGLSTLATHIARELKRTAPDRQVTFRIEPHLTAEGDHRLLRILLENLLGNAFKFSSKAPLAIIEFGGMSRDQEQVFYVRDNGAGFDMAYSNQLFVPFQRLHGRKEFAGTGIGLATVHRIVARHGGRIWAEAYPGTGATFYFTLRPPKEI